MEQFEEGFDGLKFENQKTIFRETSSIKVDAIRKPFDGAVEVDFDREQIHDEAPKTVIIPVDRVQSLTMR